MRGIAGVDPGFFLGGGEPLRNGVTDWRSKQIFKVNTIKASSHARSHPQHPSHRSAPVLNSVRGVGDHLVLEEKNSCT